jgi:hypothetical protein
VWAAWQWFTGVNVAPAIEGRIVDAGTGLPVEGAHVFVGYQLVVNPLGALASFGGSAAQHTGFQATRTMRDGSFRFAGQRLSPFRRVFWRYKGNYLHWAHREYGWDDVFGESTDLRISRNDEQTQRLDRRDPGAIRDACDSVTAPDTCQGILRASFGW